MRAFRMAQNQGACLEDAASSSREGTHYLSSMSQTFADYHIRYLRCTNLDVKLDFSIEGIVLVWASSPDHEELRSGRTPAQMMNDWS